MIRKRLLPGSIVYALTTVGATAARSWHDRSPRRTPTIYNTAWAELLVWDGRKVSLEDPALGPMSTSAEMNPGSQPPRREARSYRRLSDGVHHGLSGRGISVKNVARAIATFERTVISSTAQSHRRRTPLPPLRQSESRCQALWVSFRCRSRSGHSLRSIAMPAHARLC